MAKARKKPKPRPYSLHFSEVPKWWLDLEAQRPSFAMGDEQLVLFSREDAPAADRPPLTSREQEVFDIISEHPEGIKGPAILAELSDRYGRTMAQGTLTGQIIRTLKRYGVKNRGGVGYYIDNSP